MIVWLVNIERRKGDGSTLGPFLTREGAINALREHVGSEFDESYTDEFGSSLTEGVYYSEEESVEVYERELKP